MVMDSEKQFQSNVPNGLPEATDDIGKIYMERILSEKGGFTFLGAPLTGAPKIKSANDIAFLFKNLESAATENAFAVFIREDKSYSVLYISTGTPNGTAIEPSLIAAAAKELNAESVTLVHNHPTGKLSPSELDELLHNQLCDSLPIHVNESIIINLDSGKYCVFGGGYPYSTEKKGVKKVQEAKVYQFDKQKLYLNYGESRTKIQTSREVAEFLSRQKRGTVDKIQCIILDHSMQINRYCLYDGNLPLTELTTQIIADVGKHGDRIILSTNRKLIEPPLSHRKQHLRSNPKVQNKNVSFANKISLILERAGIKMLDFLEIEQDKHILKEYYSFAETGLLSEPQESYNGKLQNENLENYQIINKKKSITMRNEKTFVGSSYRHEFQGENGNSKGHAFNFQLNVEKLKDVLEMSANGKNEEIAINIEAKSPDKIQEKHPTHLVYVGSPANDDQRREAQLFISIEELLKLQQDEYGNVKLSAATRKEIALDLSSYSVYEDVYGTEREGQERNFVGRGYGEGENFGDTRVIGVATKHIFTDSETGERTNKSYNVSIDEEKVERLKIYEGGYAKLSLVPYDNIVTNDEGEKAKKQMYLVSEAHPKQARVEANIEIEVADIKGLIPQKNKGNDGNSYKIIVADRNPDNIQSNKADLLVYADKYIPGMTKEEAKAANSIKTYVGNGWTRVPSELALSTTDLTSEGLEKAIKNGDGVRVTAILHTNSNIVEKKHLELAQKTLSEKDGSVGKEKSNRIYNSVKKSLDKKSLKQNTSKEQIETQAKTQEAKDTKGKGRTRKSSGVKM